MIRVVQHRHKCIGCNACVEADAFRWRISKNDGKSVLIGGIEKKGWFSVLVDDHEEKALEQAKVHCPVNIIRFEKI
ncbi:MAG: ferredoxin [Bacteroidetes bacterium]|nr:MAG: ferredoxin [Bacteroidota bacterium]